MDENNAYFDNISDSGQRTSVGQSQGRASRPETIWQSDMPMRAPEPPKGDNGSGKGLFVGGVITGIAATLLILAICYVGFYIQGSVESGMSLSNQVEFEKDSAINQRMISKLQVLEDTIKKNFYLSEVVNEELQEGIYKGMLESLGDPYSEYYTAAELNSLMQSTEGIYYGIGAYISLDANTGLPKISNTMAGAPSEEAGLRANDLIYEVEGVSTYGMTLTEVTSLIKGPENTEVALTIVRYQQDGNAEYLDITCTRRRVESPTVEYKKLEDGMAYIQVTEFDEVTIKQFEDALATARADGMKGLILDLRANPGGSLNAVVQMARMILPEGMIVYTENKNGERFEYTCDGKRELDVPLVLLVDMNSASASEIMAGAIKDYGIGTLVGTPTFGKGIVQQIIPFKDGSAVKVTISAYYTPNGNNIHGIGIEPDVLCEFDGAAYYGSEDRPDNQLEKAKEVLREKLGK